MRSGRERHTPACPACGTALLEVSVRGCRTWTCQHGCGGHRRAFATGVVRCPCHYEPMYLVRSVPAAARGPWYWSCAELPSRRSRLVAGVGWD